MQFEYKEGHSTIICSLIYKDVISYYPDSEGVLYSYLLDVCKEFDRVHFGMLFDIYLRQEIYIMWDRIKSEYFCTSNGVNRGGG